MLNTLIIEEIVVMKIDGTRNYQLGDEKLPLNIYDFMLNITIYVVCDQRGSKNGKEKS